MEFESALSSSDFRESGCHMQDFDKRKQPIFHFSERGKEKNRLYLSGKTGFQSDFILPVFRKYETKTKVLLKYYQTKIVYCNG